MASCATIQPSVIDPLKDNPKVVFRDLTKPPNTVVANQNQENQKEIIEIEESKKTEIIQSLKTGEML